MFRSAHSLKGLSAMLGLTDISTLTHKVENVFDAARKDELAIDGDVVELVFQAIDRLENSVEALKDPDQGSVECESIVERIGQLLRNAVQTRADLAGRCRARLGTETAAVPANSTLQPGAILQVAPPTPENCETPPNGKTLPGEATVAAAVDCFANLEDGECPAKYLPIYIDEAEMSLDQLTETLLATEADGGTRPWGVC